LFTNKLVKCFRALSNYEAPLITFTFVIFSCRNSVA